MFSNGAGKSCTRRLEDLGPFGRIKFFSCKHWDKVFVAKLRRRAEGFFVVGSLITLAVAGSIHVVGVPGSIWPTLRYRVDSPMGVYPKLIVLEPFWCAMIP